MKTPVSIVRIKTKGQVTLPTAIREKAGLHVGDLLEAKLERDGKITLTRKSLIDRGIEQGLADIKAGRTYGPFHSMEDMLADLDQRMAKRKKRSNTHG
jgi:AbrB family looped-hinge helix DNA binding protein